MNLKNAFRYQNFITDLINTTTRYLMRKEYVTTTMQEHMRTKSDPNAVDETTKVDLFPKPFDCEVNDLISFLQNLVTEKAVITRAIYAAKRDINYDIDGELAMNRVKQQVANVLSDMSEIKSSERIGKAQGYRFNVEGNQVSYYYDVKDITTIDFDRNKVKAIFKNMLSETDEVSTKVDSLMIETEVDFTPLYDVNDKYEDALASFLKKTE